MRDCINKHIAESIEVKSSILNSEILISAIEKTANIIVEAYKNNGKVLIAGNGGSASDAQHIATEFVSKFYIDRNPLKALALTTNTSILTAIGNDYGQEYIFARQIQAYGNKNDVYVSISTSGNSKNIIKSIAVRHPRQRQLPAHADLCGGNDRFVLR